MVVANGVRLNVTEFPSRRRESGAMDSIPTICIHGLAASSAFWFGAGAKMLSLGGPVLLYDLRGHGKSETPQRGYALEILSDDVVALMDHYGYERVNLVAHSFGGMIALYTALRHPERIASLTMVDVRVRPIQKTLALRTLEVSETLQKRLEAIGIPLSSISNYDDGINYLNAVARIQVAAGDEANEILTELYQHPRLFKSLRNAQKWIDLSENPAVVANLKAKAPFGKDEISSIKAPILILAGGNSPTLGSAQTMSELCPHAVFHEIPDVGHFFPVSNPRLFLRPTLRFLRAVLRQDPRLLEPRRARA